MPARAAVNILKSIRDFPAIFASILFVAASAFVLGAPIVGALATGLLAFCLNFFRVPNRKIPAGKGLVISSADGHVMSIDDAEEAFFLKEPARRIVIFMNVFSLHRNLAPFDGTLTYARYERGRFRSAFRKSAALENEHNVLGFTGDGQRVAISQVAGLIARRIVMPHAVGASFHAGEEFGLIRFGSANVVFVPRSYEVLVRRGQAVRAGETVLARKN